MEYLVMRKLTIPFAVGGALLFSTAAAEPSSEVAWTPDTYRFAQSGDAANGKKIAVEVCDECHGAGGVSEEDDFPNIAGQLETYLYKQLVDFKSGKRKNRKMRRRVKDLSEQELADLSAWYAQLPAEPQGPEAPVHELVTRGDPKRMITSCNACHGDEAKGGDMDVPMLKGQPADLFVEMMEDFRDGSRANDVYGRMRQAAEALSDEEIEALARYYAGLPVQ